MGGSWEGLSIEEEAELDAAMEPFLKRWAAAEKRRAFWAKVLPPIFVAVAVGLAVWST